MALCPLFWTPIVGSTSSWRRPWKFNNGRLPTLHMQNSSTSRPSLQHPAGLICSRVNITPYSSGEIEIWHFKAVSKEINYILFACLSCASFKNLPRRSDRANMRPSPNDKGWKQVPSIPRPPSPPPPSSTHPPLPALQTAPALRLKITPSVQSPRQQFPIFLSLVKPNFCIRRAHVAPCKVNLWQGSPFGGLCVM